MPRTKKQQHPDWPATEIVQRSVAELVPYARNARTHTQAQVAKIAASIREWGWTTPVLVDESNGIIAGHGRLMAAELLKITEVPCIVARGWTDAQKRAYVIADNQLALEAGWDKELLRVEFAELEALDFDLELTGFGEADIKTLLAPVGGLEDDPESVPEKPKDPTTRTADVWELGPHRVVCGDSTDEAVVKLAIGDLDPRLMVTDPPYGVEYDPEWRKKAGVNNSDRMGKVSNDDRIDWTAVWRLFPGAVAYVWHADKHCGEVAANLHEAGFEIRAQIIWVKSRFALSRGNYHWQHEPCWYAVRKGSKAFWIGDRSQSTVWDIAMTDDGDETIHGTQKPLECMGRPMRHHDADVVFDPFLGSGSTLIAAHLQDRVCVGIDLDPGYVDVAVGRWERHSGKPATLAGDGRTFADVAKERAKKPTTTRRKKKTARKP